MPNINQEMELLVAEMQEIRQLPAPMKVGSHSNLTRYRDLREQILEKFLSAFGDGYRLGKEALKDGKGD